VAVYPSFLRYDRPAAPVALPPDAKKGESLMVKREKQAPHWSEQKEQTAGYWHVKLLLIIFKVWPMFLMRLGAYPVALFYFLFSKKVRDYSRRFLKRVAACFAAEGKAFPVRVFRHILAFSLTVVEKVETWGGKVTLDRIHFQDDDVGDLIATLDRGEGALFICSHLGNAELLRGLANFNRTGVSRPVPVTSIVDFSVTAYFNRMLWELNPDSTLRVISANDIGPDTVILLQDRLAAGEIVVITGDRTAAKSRNKYFLFPFLNEDAPFAYGPFFLASLLNVPTYLVFALRQGDISLASRYNMHVYKSAVSFDCSRRERAGRVEALARFFVEKLEYHCRRYPYQWYNFYDFWAKPKEQAKIAGSLMNSREEKCV
jgi:predicted LPLAT superfamily acyltransferase